MSCVIFAFVEAPATNAWFGGVASADVFVEGGLCLFVEMAEGL